MIEHALGQKLVAIPMAIVAGFVDAVAFLHLGGYFVSFMTGNTTRLGASLAEASAQALLPASLIALFVGGVVAATLFRGRVRGRRPGWVMAMVSLLLALAAGAQALDHQWLCIGLLAVAMGAENAVFLRNGEVSIGVTYMTGTLVKLGQRIAGALSGGDRTAWAWYLLLWLGLAAGSVLGAAAFLAFDLAAIWIAAFGAAAIAATFLFSRLDFA